MSGEFQGKKILLGLGFDCEDGLLRVTKGKNFKLYGGSEETHGVMQEKAIKFNEQMKKKSKQIETLTRAEFLDIADTVGLNVVPPPEE
jgi:hypothetical protein